MIKSYSLLKKTVFLFKNKTKTKKSKHKSKKQHNNNLHNKNQNKINSTQKTININNKIWNSKNPHSTTTNPVMKMTIKAKINHKTLRKLKLLKPRRKTKRTRKKDDSNQQCRERILDFLNSTLHNEYSCFYYILPLNKSIKSLTIISFISIPFHLSIIAFLTQVSHQACSSTQQSYDTMCYNNLPVL